MAIEPAPCRQIGPGEPVFARVAYCQSPRGSLLCHRRGIASSNSGLDTRQIAFTLALSSALCVKPRVDGSGPQAKTAPTAPRTVLPWDAEASSYGPFIAKRPLLARWRRGR